jgi:large subunit ribosomal protein L21
MYAVIQTGGKQYRVAPGDMLKIEKLEGNVGDSIAFDKVLFTSDGDNINLGKPFLE